MIRIALEIFKYLLSPVFLSEPPASIGINDWWGDDVITIIFGKVLQTHLKFFFITEFQPSRVISYQNHPHRSTKAVQVNIKLGDSVQKSVLFRLKKENSIFEWMIFNIFLFLRRSQVVNSKEKNLCLCNIKIRFIFFKYLLEVIFYHLF